MPIKGRRPRTHDCDHEILGNRWAMAATRQPGERWTCPCGQQYEHDCDEAAGCTWLRVEKEVARVG